MRLKDAMVFGLLATCVLLVGAACGGEQGGGGSETPEKKTGKEATTEATLSEETTSSLETEATEPITARAETTAAGAPQTEEAREVVVVKIVGLSYEPSVVEVAPGTTVRWLNDGSADHTVTSGEAGGPLASDVFNPGGSFEYTFEEQGEFAYFCEIHPFMTGSVIVG